MDSIRIDIVSDIACPWCAIGYKRLQHAMRELEDEFEFELEWHPFELNPRAGPEGEEILEHLARKYGRSPAEMAQSQQQIMALANELGLDFSKADQRRSHNTFDAHRVLAWAKEQGRQTEFNLALFHAYFGEARNPSDPAVLRGIAESLGLDTAAVDGILSSDRYAQEVRDEEERFMQAGVSAVPAFIINGQYLISGGQEPQVFVDAFRRITKGEMEVEA